MNYGEKWQCPRPVLWRRLGAGLTSGSDHAPAKLILSWDLN